ncbi:MAG: hypothetical protein MI919_39275, partial [Holophagales bacterium]|nr:hypothetical protein [Holophagales bacterium]
MKKLLLVSLVGLAWLATGLCLADDLPALADGDRPAETATLAAHLPSMLAVEAPETCNVSAADSLGGRVERVTCTADCGSAPDVTCSTSGSCTAVDRNCGVGEPGHVTCGASTTYCPACQCTNGQVRYYSTSACCCRSATAVFGPTPRAPGTLSDESPTS